MKLNQLQDRGQKKANFHVLRESNMPALLTENGFIDNAQDAALMKQSSWRQKVAQGHANGVAKAFNLQRKQENDSGAIYKVIAGSFKSKENADERVSFLRSKGIDSYVDTISISGGTWYRVQAGAFQAGKMQKNVWMKSKRPELVMLILFWKVLPIVLIQKVHLNIL